MGFRFYLIPLETDPEKMVCDRQPKYLDILGVCNGVHPLVDRPWGQEWNRSYYIVKCDENQELEQKTDVVKLCATTDKQALEALGIDTSTITEARYELVDKAVTEWYMEQQKVLSEIL